MSSISALNSGIQGIHRGLEGMRRDAAEIASAKNMNGEDMKDVFTPLTHLIIDRTQVAISAKVIKTAGETIGTLLDVKA
jgi:hypothetical protein